MKKLIALAAILLFTADLSGHCQMPCGIFHDEIVFAQLDQYVETLNKGIHSLAESKFSTPKERADVIRWVALKDQSCDEMASLITTYFLQQKIKPDAADAAQKLASAHRLLVLLPPIKQNVDAQTVESFTAELDKFKGLFGTHHQH